MSYQLEVAATRAGVTEAVARRYAGLGLVDEHGTGVFSDSDIKRIQVLDILEGAGVSVDDVAELAEQGRVSLQLIDATGQYVFAQVSDRTFGEAAETTGIPFQTLATIRESMGGRPPESSDRLGEEELVVLSLIEKERSLNFEPHTIERTLRVYGESLRRIAETESEMFRSEIARPLTSSGGTETDLGQFVAEYSPILTELTDKVLLAIYHRQQRHTWSVNIIDAFSSALEEAGLHQREGGIPAICFLDITGYTRLTDERGDRAAADLAEGVRRTVERLAVTFGGRAIKWLGDGVMLHFPAPTSAVEGALEMVSSLDTAGMAAAHVGVDAGPVVFREGDYYGQTVNVAARLSDFARPGEVLVTQSVVGLVDDQRLGFAEIGPVELQGVADRLVLYSASRSR